MNDLIVGFLNMTAVPMEVQPVFGAFHIIASLACIILAVLLARVIARSLPNHSCIPDVLSNDAPSDSEAVITDAATDLNGIGSGLNDHGQLIIIRILSCCGWFLIITEIWKQLFICYIMNDGVYDYWFLPFQLCSVPMYLCILLPYVSSGLRSTFLSFMASYTFTSAICTFIYPEDLLRPYLLLTMHGFIWHGILLFISLLILFSGAADLSLAGFGRATVLFLELSVLAILLNIITEPCAARIAANGAVHSYPNMFYMNPYNISTQPLIGSVQNILGIPAGIAIYASAIIALSGLTSFAFRRSRSDIHS